MVPRDPWRKVAKPQPPVEVTNREITLGPRTRASRCPWPRNAGPAGESRIGSRRIPAHDQAQPQRWRRKRFGSTHPDRSAPAASTSSELV